MAEKQRRPRWVLHLQAQMWRFLMGIGMLLHKLAPPRPPRPIFTRTIDSTLAATRVQEQKKNGGKGYPVLINFHGGGFTLGTATDDARWCSTVVEECGAVVVSVEYRLAPECPFPTAVEDGVDAILWVAEHAEELGIDATKIALSGFSSGANMAFTVPIRLHDHLTGFSRSITTEDVPIVHGMRGNPELTNEGSSTEFAITPAGSSQKAQQQHLDVPSKRPELKVTGQTRVDICAICPWYPPTDYTQTREQRRATCARKDQELPALFTDLFDESYLYPPDTLPLDSPYLSPGIAPTKLLRDSLPKDVFLFTCEWDMLLAEGVRFRDRLQSEELGKHVVYRMIEGVPHGWDKAPNPIKPTPGVKEHYEFACRQLSRVWGPDVSGSRRRSSIFVR
ncbi:hypothetical protein H2203_000007 [Taxawa tesnikishii (nom. ined.)]|nr:hypothetical protein H2203_000007 [Dothideales sp. JES 119]